MRRYQTTVIVGLSLMAAGMQTVIWGLGHTGQPARPTPMTPISVIHWRTIPAPPSSWASPDPRYKVVPIPVARDPYVWPTDAEYPRSQDA
jgi:hypothetical protein